jgi:phenylacetate-coenzyme A ligase PaaK-like adenylate-forming protein
VAADGAARRAGRAPGHHAGISFWQRQARLRPGLAAPLHQLSVTRPLPELIEDLNRLAPIFLSSYPSMLSELAEAQGDGRLHIRPALLWAGGEALADAARQRIEQAFEAPLGCDYGSSEMLVIACECAQHHLHVNDDWVLLEPVDEAGRPVPPGRAALGADQRWANRVQPFIADLGDSITVATSPCPMATRDPITVQGRCDAQLAGGQASPMRLTR